MNDNEAKKEIGKGFIGFANLVGGLSIINSLFVKTPTAIDIFLVLYVFVGAYISGYLIIKGAKNGTS